LVSVILIVRERGTGITVGESQKAPVPSEGAAPNLTHFDECPVE